MCRLLGYATAGFNLSLTAMLGEKYVDDFRDLSEIHNDGWGVAQLADPGETPYVRDGGAPSPETGVRLYKSTIAARHDDTFNVLANEAARGALWHLRLASSNLPLIMENQQPFYANGLSFIHNGDISDDNGRNIITNRSYPVDHSVVLSTGGRSDSAIFFAVILEYIGFGFPLDEAVAQAVRELRQSYPKSSYNCMIQSEDQLIALRASGREATSPRIVEIYDQYGRGEQAHDYRVLRYRALTDASGRPAGIVVSSSGYEQRAEEGWIDLDNDQMIVASNRNGSWRLRSI
ncbi:class II glutamine amidotransferase [Bifidobacterium oedipodis]|uniref:Class II glutamine amidotransferase n=1 Tax=Bifidobacterium oedipodis TaxID=2675322 RepID=A0A7Y0ERD5_9BIFI|nr:class II glutamine amidotransferase [Bifidobacterium sp. DSM 109957]NMM94944.1 class II glutamine amidotransferase [Bifidobacterium sp. DSM 109957]